MLLLSESGAAGGEGLSSSRREPSADAGRTSSVSKAPVIAGEVRMRGREASSARCISGWLIERMVRELDAARDVLLETWRLEPAGESFVSPNAKPGIPLGNEPGTQARVATCRRLIGMVLSQGPQKSFCPLAPNPPCGLPPWSW